MKLNFNFKRIIAIVVITLPGLFPLYTTAQSNGCQNEKILWTESFGQGTTPTPWADVINLDYRATGSFLDEGIYKVTDNVQQLPDWHNATDHTGNPGGRMLVVNGNAVDFFQKIVTSTDAAGFGPGTYTLSLYAMNANFEMICGNEMLKARLRITVEYKDGAGNWVALTNSPYTADQLEITPTPVWINITGSFDLPQTGTIGPSEIRITIADLEHGGCGNDFAIDDISFAICMGGQGGPMPVTFLDLTAQQKDNGVSLNWGTSQEINNDRFEAERSADGNSNWQLIATVPGAGNSNIRHNYNAFDGSPLSGMNYYRIRQVDIDGHSSYSKTVGISVDNSISRVAIVGNPFRNNFTVQFSGIAREVTARLLDITGKQVVRETWSTSNGRTNKQFSNLSSIQNGIYILIIQDKSGEILFNGKVLKQ